MTPILKIEKLNYNLKDKTKILKDINLNIYPNEIVSIIGKSGVGKTTLLKTIAGLQSPSSGTVVVNDQDTTGKTGNLGYMFQKDLLLEFKTILQNVLLPKTIQRKNYNKDDLKSLFSIFGISNTENKYPHELSGGMRQRAALLRTYLTNKPCNLLDEPFSALDEITQYELYRWYLKISCELNLTTVFITHNITEALLLSDRILILNGSPATIINNLKIKYPNKLDSKFQNSQPFQDLKRVVLSSL